MSLLPIAPYTCRYNSYPNTTVMSARTLFVPLEVVVAFAESLVTRFAERFPKEGAFDQSAIAPDPLYDIDVCHAAMIRHVQQTRQHDDKLIGASLI